MAAVFEHADQVRAALQLIASDPGAGGDAFASASTLANLLRDFLPDAPRETGLLIGAVSAGVPAMLRGHLAHGMDREMAVSLAAASLVSTTAFTEDACLWVVAELADVLGSEHPNEIPGQNRPQPVVAEAVQRPLDLESAPTMPAFVGATLDQGAAAELEAWHQLAEQAGAGGNPAAARDQYAALLRVRESLLGPEHSDTLSTRHNLASWTGEAGDAASARDQYSALVPIRERVLGAEHPATLKSRHNLARWTGEAGDPTSARDQYAALLPIRERVLGSGHPSTLLTRSALAYWTKKAKRRWS